MSGLLQVDDVHKAFGGLSVLRGVSFTARPGEILGLIGPNGAGKTTLFNIITSMLRPDRGRVLLDGVELTRRPPHEACRLGVARTFQIPRPFLSMTVYDNVLTAALLRERDPRRRHQMVVRSIQRVRLHDKVMAPAASLTGQERRRLEIARALATGPRVLLLDEVLSGLNPSELKLFIDILRELQQEGLTIIMVEHIISAIVKLCQRVAVLHGGTLIALDTPEAVMKDRRVIEAYLGEGEPVAAG